MNSNLLLLFVGTVLTLTLCQNETKRELLEFPELEIGRSKRQSDNSLEKGEYCAVYRLNYDYYCRGIWTGEKLVTHSRHLDRIKKFCPTYKEACVHYKRSRLRHHNRKYKHREPESLEQEYRRKSYREILEELAEIIPCTPECNQNVHPHCTQECKCDYDYPRMQRFCNPPALPLFLNTCRIWYNQCPKYEQYHYSSQYIYSKAEKGKTIATPLPPVDQNWQQQLYYGGNG